MQKRLFLSIVVICGFMGCRESVGETVVPTQFQFLCEDGGAVAEAVFSLGEIYPQHQAPIAAQCGPNGVVTIPLPADIKQNSWLWLRLPTGEMMGFSLEKCLKGGVGVKQPILCQIPRAVSKTVAVSSAANPEFLANAKVLFWWEKADSLGCFWGEVDRNGKVNARLVPETACHICVFASINEQKYAYASQMSWDSRQGEIALKDWQIKNKSCGAESFRIFPFFAGVYPSTTNTNAVIQEACFQMTPFPQLPPDSLFCVFYEGEEGYDLIGPNGTLAFTRGKIRTLPNPNDPKGRQMEVYQPQSQKWVRLETIELAPPPRDEGSGDVEFHFQNPKDAPQAVTPISLF